MPKKSIERAARTNIEWHKDPPDENTVYWNQFFPNQYKPGKLKSIDNRKPKYKKRTKNYEARHRDPFTPFPHDSIQPAHQRDYQQQMYFHLSVPGDEGKILEQRQRNIKRENSNSIIDIETPHDHLAIQNPSQARMRQKSYNIHKYGISKGGPKSGFKQAQKDFATRSLALQTKKKLPQIKKAAIKQNRKISPAILHTLAGSGRSGIKKTK